MRQAELDLQFTELGRRSPAASATAACRPAISSPAAPAATRRCSRPSCRSIRSASSSPSTRRPTCATSGSRAAARTLASRGTGVEGRAEADRRAGLQPRRHDGLRRQRDRPLDRHDPRPRRSSPIRTALFTPGMFARVRVPALAALRGAAGAGRRDRQRAGAQVRHGGRADDNVATQKYVDARPARRTTCASSRTGCRADDRVIVNGLTRVAARREGHAAGAGARRPRRAGPQAKPQLGSRRHEDLAFLHRPADLRLGDLDRVHHPGRRRVSRACRSRNIPRSRRRPSTSPASIPAPAPRRSPRPWSRRSSSRSTASRGCSTSPRTRPPTGASRSR